MFRKIFGPIYIDGKYRRIMNGELFDLYDDVELVRCVKIQRLCWLDHIVRMDEKKKNSSDIQDT